jgi:hypothetical protein
MGLLLAGCAANGLRSPADPGDDGAVAESSSGGLVGTSWRLEDLAGNGVLDGVSATVEFPEAGRVVRTRP